MAPACDRWEAPVGFVRFENGPVNVGRFGHSANGRNRNGFTRTEENRRNRNKETTESSVSVAQMLGKVVVLLVIGLAIALAPAASAEETSSDASGGECVWTSSSGGKPGAGANVRNCVEDSAQGANA